MRYKAILLGLLFSLASFATPLNLMAQDEDVRGAFLTTRPKASAKGKTSSAAPKASRRRPKVVPDKASNQSKVAAADAKTPAQLLRPESACPAHGSRAHALHA